jgi:hypothetical protein
VNSVGLCTLRRRRILVLGSNTLTSLVADTVRGAIGRRKLGVVHAGASLPAAAQRDKQRLAVGAQAQTRGRFPTGIVATTRSVARSITVTSFESSLLT